MTTTMVTNHNRVFWPREDVLAACRTYGPLVDPIEGVDGVRLLVAMAMNESSLGENCGPRHEAIYDVGGRYAKDARQASLLNQFGHLAACSYGPWQIMLVNANGCTPMELNINLALCTRVSISFLNQRIRDCHAKSVADVGMLWNGGHVMSPPEQVPEEVQMYVKELESNYEAAEMWLEKP